MRLGCLKCNESDLLHWWDTVIRVGDIVICEGIRTGALRIFSAL